MVTNTFCKQMSYTGVEASYQNNMLYCAYFFYLRFWNFDLIQWSFNTASTINLVIMTVEKYLKIVHSIWYRAKVSEFKVCTQISLSQSTATPMQYLTLISGSNISHKQLQNIPIYGIISLSYQGAVSQSLLKIKELLTWLNCQHQTVNFF